MDTKGVAYGRKDFFLKEILKPLIRFQINP